MSGLTGKKLSAVRPIPQSALQSVYAVTHPEYLKASFFFLSIAPGQKRICGRKGRLFSVPLLFITGDIRREGDETENDGL